MQREYKRHGFFRFVHEDSRNRELMCLKPGESGINTLCRVMEVSTKNIRTKEGQEKVVYTGIIADYTAKLPFVSWTERVVKNNVVQIENAHVKEWKGLPTLYIGRKTQLHEQDIDFPGYAELRKPKKRTIEDIVGCGGAFDVIVEGDIVSSSAKGNRMVLDDGTGAVFLDSGANSTGISFGTPVKARGNVVAESEGYYVLIAEKVKVTEGGLVIREMKHFLSRYT